MGNWYLLVCFIATITTYIPPAIYHILRHTLPPGRSSRYLKSEHGNRTVFRPTRADCISVIDQAEQYVGMDPSMRETCQDR